MRVGTKCAKLRQAFGVMKTLWLRNSPYPASTREPHLSIPHCK
jgi:hypothetical protein